METGLSRFHLSLELNGAEVAEVRVTSAAIVERFDVVKDNPGSGLG